MGIVERRSRHKASLRRQIVEATSRLVAQQGGDDVTLRQIAAKIEYTPTTIYLHFRGRDELMSAVCEHVFDELHTTVDAIESRTSEPTGVLRDMLEAWVVFGVSRAAHYGVASRLLDLTAGAAAADQLVRGPIPALMSRIRGQVLRCGEHGMLGLADVDAASRLVCSAAHGAILLVNAEPEPLTSSLELVAKQVVGALMNALLHGDRTSVRAGEPGVYHNRRSASSAVAPAPSAVPAEASPKPSRPKAAGREFSFMN